MQGVEKLTGIGTIAACARVAGACTAAEVDGVLLDLFTASTILAVYEKLGPANKILLEEMSLPKAASVCLKLAAQ